MSKVVESMASRLGVKRFMTSPFHPQANGCVERCNRTIAQDLACFVSTGHEDWDQHVSLACFRYNTGINDATGLSPFRAMFGVDAFEACGEAELGRVAGEAEDLGGRLADLHRQLVRKAEKERRRASNLYDKYVEEARFSIGARVLLWSPEHTNKEESKIVPSWLGPYTVEEKLSPVGFLLRSEAGGRTARVHVNRMRNIGMYARETGDPKDGVFPDSLRLLAKICGVKEIEGLTETQRWFKVQLRGRQSPSWTNEEELPEVVVRMFDDGKESRRSLGRYGEWTEQVYG